MIEIGLATNHYSRKDVISEMLRLSTNREIGIRYGDGFGKRPDVLKYEGDILELAKNGVTSFHVSEERWFNPLLLGNKQKREDMDSNRAGWDLVLDVDCPQWKISKIISWLIVKAIRDHGIKSVSIRFSGNKGFHIGVPFEAFPQKIMRKTKEGVEMIDTRLMFPEVVRKISKYLLDYISRNYITVNDGTVKFGGKYVVSLGRLNQVFPDKELLKNFCTRCGKFISNPNIGKKIEHSCMRCGSIEISNFSEDEKGKVILCNNCKIPMDVHELSMKGGCEHQFFKYFNASSIVEVDNILIASRHLYRMAYSLHEKSGLVSVPFNPDKIMEFEKKYASPATFKIGNHKFLDIDDVSSEEGKSLIEKSIDFSMSFEEEKERKETQFDDFSDKIPRELFPPCIIRGMQGVIDGKKRFMFSSIDFLSNCNYSQDEIEAIVMDWNNKSPEPLKENLIIGQTRYNKERNQKIMPPNCFYSEDKATGFYKELGIRNPDNFCARIKNPFQYSKRKSQSMEKTQKPKKDKSHKDF